MIEGQYKVWCPDQSDEKDADQIEAFAGPADAARIWFSDRWAGMDCPRRAAVLVRDWTGQLWRMNVFAERTVDYSADEPVKREG